MGGRLCSRPTTISLHKVAPGNACVHSTQITGSSLQSTDNDSSTQDGPWQCVRAFHMTDDNFSTQGGPWQCVRAFHTNNRVASATTISLHKAVPGNACVRSTHITGSPLQSTDNNFSAQGTPWQCVRAFHTNNRVVSAVDRQRFLYT